MTVQSYQILKKFYQAAVHETEMRYPDISPDVFRPALLKEMRCFMLILPILALIANSLALHIRCSTPGSKAFKTFVALLVMVVNSFANLFLIMSRILESLLWTVTLVIDTTETCCSIVFWTISVYTI